tara:strand:- start:1176 stop:1448 length:273 start_codon:yes stop_codon:yes gene_type:complete
MIDETIKMPKALKHFLFFTTGISGILYMYKGNQDVGFGFSAMLFACGVLSALASYGLISLLTDIKEAGTLQGAWEIVKNRALMLFKNNAN